MPDATTIPRTQYTVAGLDLELDVFENLQLLSLRQDGDTMSLIQSHKDLRIALWAGGQQTLAAWRGRLESIHKCSFGDEQPTTICGAPARKQEAAIASAPPAVGAVVGDDGSIGHVYQEAPAETHVAVAFTHKGRKMVLSWIVPTSQRDRYRADEERLFASVACL